MVVEEINTLPYFAPWLPARRSCSGSISSHGRSGGTRTPTARGLRFPARALYLRLNSKMPALVLSASTRRTSSSSASARSMCRSSRRRSSLASRRRLAREGNGLLVYVGRVTPSKRVDHLVEALARCVPQASTRGSRSSEEGSPRLALRSSGRARPRSRGPGPLLRLRRRASEARSLARAALIVMASAREGWGLVVTEANAVGTPAVVYDRPGLRDSTVHEETGLVTSPNPQALAAGIRRALTEPGLYARLQAGALEWSREFTWERASSAFERVLVEVAGPSRRRFLRSETVNRAAPSVSVVIPTLNAARYLEECLGAVRGQEYAGGVEIIIVDAGSTDRTLEIAGRFGVDRILENPLNTGEAGKAVGFRAARES